MAERPETIPTMAHSRSPSASCIWAQPVRQVVERPDPPDTEEAQRARADASRRDPGAFGRFPFSAQRELDRRAGMDAREGARKLLLRGAISGLYHGP